MDKKFIYNNQDITVDVYEKIRRVVEIIAEREKVDFDEIHKKFCESKTFQALQLPESLMWSESAEFIVDEYYRE